MGQCQCFGGGRQETRREESSPRRNDGAAVISGAAAGNNPSSSTAARNSPPSSEGDDREDASFVPRKFTFNELDAITKSFKEELGRGASAVVYKGTLQTESGYEEVAVKKMFTGDGDQSNLQFQRETSILTKVRHRTIIKMIGYCSRGNKDRFIVYEYMPLGTLESCMDGINKPNFNWISRMKVARGIAKALTVLHSEKPPIIHGDINSANILIGEDFEPKLSDFGRAVYAPSGHSMKSADAIMLGRVSEYQSRSFSTDVYNFGMLLLNLICGQEDKEAGPDPSLNGNLPIADFEELRNLAHACIHDHRKSRPDMKSVYSSIKSLSRNNA